MMVEGAHVGKGAVQGSRGGHEGVAVGRVCIQSRLLVRRRGGGEGM